MHYLEQLYRNTDEEYGRIKDFLIRLQSRVDHDNNWDPGRMDWWRYNVHYDKGEDFFAANIRYWTLEEGEVIALALSEYGQDDVFLIVDPAHRVMYDQVFDWVINDFGDNKQAIRTSVFTHDSDKVERLEARGFVMARHESNVRLYRLDDAPYIVELPAGYRMLTFLEYGDFEGKSRLICDAFNKSSHPVERIQSFIETPGYLPELDLVVVSEEGSAVAYCTGWVETYDASLGYLEPMGTHTQFRRRGLASALARECFNRLNDRGVRHVSIASDAEPDPSNLLYDALGPVLKKKAFEFTLSC